MLLVAIPVLAVLYDVTADDAIVDVGQGVLFWKTDLGPFGSGLVDSFLRIQDSDSDEQGYNTDAAPEFDETNSFTDAMPLTEVPQTTINGTVYREVILDINEDNDANITLEKFQVFTSGAAAITGYNAGPPPNIGGATTLVFDLDATQDNQILLVDHASGSGSSDYAILIPDSLFAAGPNCDFGDRQSNCGRYLNIFALFTGIGDGFEEFAVGDASPIVNTPTNTPTNTATNTPVVPTNTATNTPTNTPVVPTNTATNTPTNTPVVPTNTATNTPTNTPVVPTNTATNTPTNTPVVPTATPTDTPTNTPVVPTATPTDTPTNTPAPPTATPTNTPVPNSCPGGAASYSYTSMLGTGLGSETINRNGARVDVPNNQNVIELYAQLAGKKFGSWNYARFIRPNGTFINDKTLESPAYRNNAIFWYGQQLTSPTLPYWKARLVGAPTSGPFVQRAFVLYPTYSTAQQYVDVVDYFENSAQNHVYWQWIPVQVQSVALPAPLTTVDLVVRVALVDNDPDARPVDLTIEAGGVSQTVTQTDSTHGPLLSIIEVTLENVPAGTSQVVLTLESPLNIGDSVAMIGMTANYICTP
jgi:hypothetical protein